MTYDAIVLGLGGMGSSAAFHLAQRGLRTLGLEQFAPAHDRGSSHGVTRIIRKAYFEHPAYVPLLHSAYREWEALEQQTGRKLFVRNGLLLVGHAEGQVLPGVRRAAREHGLDIREVPIGEVAERFPGFRPADETEALFERDAGYLLVEECVRAYLEAARRHGAELRFESAVESWRAEGREVAVTCAGEELRADRLVLCAGPWSGRLLGESSGNAALGRRLSVRRKVQLWFGCSDRRYEPERFPVFCCDSKSGFFYGFPTVQPGRLKVAEHSGGQALDRADLLDRRLHAEDIAPVRRFVERCLPGVSNEVAAHSVCMYTMTPDEHFIIGRHPEFENVVLAAGFSGHGFKFAGVVGSILADLAIRGRTDEPIGFLEARRFHAATRASS